VVTRCGDGVTRFRPGDRVMATLAYGGLAEQAVAKESETFAIPDGMSFDEAGGVSPAFFSGFVANLWERGLEAGEAPPVAGRAGSGSPQWRSARPWGHASSQERVRPRSSRWRASTAPTTS